MPRYVLAALLMLCTTAVAEADVAYTFSGPTAVGAGETFDLNVLFSSPSHDSNDFVASFDNALFRVNAISIPDPSSFFDLVLPIGPDQANAEGEIRFGTARFLNDPAPFDGILAVVNVTAIGPSGVGLFNILPESNVTFQQTAAGLTPLSLSYTGGFDVGYDLAVTIVPEPASIALIGSGIAGLALAARRRGIRNGTQEDGISGRCRRTFGAARGRDGVARP